MTTAGTGVYIEGYKYESGIFGGGNHVDIMKDDSNFSKAIVALAAIRAGKNLSSDANAPSNQRVSPQDVINLLDEMDAKSDNDKHRTMGDVNHYCAKIINKSFESDSMVGVVDMDRCDLLPIFKGLDVKCLNGSIATSNPSDVNEIQAAINKYMSVAYVFYGDVGSLLTIAAAMPDLSMVADEDRAAVGKLNAESIATHAVEARNALWEMGAPTPWLKVD